MPRAKGVDQGAALRQELLSRATGYLPIARRYGSDGADPEDRRRLYDQHVRPLLRLMRALEAGKRVRLPAWKVHGALGQLGVTDRPGLYSGEDCIIERDGSWHQGAKS